MRRRRGTPCVRLAAVVLAAIGLTPALTRAQVADPTSADAQTWARSAEAQARAAHALAQTAPRRFPGVAEGAADLVSEALGGSRRAAEAAADHALEAAGLASELANEAAARHAAVAANPVADAQARARDTALIVNALAAARAAQACAQRADAAVKAVDFAYLREQARAAVAAESPAAAALAATAAAAATQAKASLDKIEGRDNDTAVQNQRLADLGAARDPRLDQAIARNGQAAVQLGFVTFEAGQVPPPPAVPAALAAGTFFKVDSTTPVKLKVTYNLKRKPGDFDFDFENGKPDGSAKLVLVPTGAFRPLRVRISLTFTDGSNGLFTIPRTPPLRFALDQGKYACSDADMKRIAHDFVRIINEVDRNFASPNHPPDPVIPITNVTILIEDDNGGQVDQLQGWLQITPQLVNVRN